MQTLKRNWLAVVILIALAAGVAISLQESASRASTNAQNQIELRNNAVAGCIRTSRRTALSAELGKVLSERVGARGRAGDEESAKKYAAVGGGVAATIPLPKGKTVADAAQVRFVDGKAFVTNTALKVQADGCEQAYPLPRDDH